MVYCVYLPLRYIDSLEQHPSKMTFDQFRKFVTKHKAAFPIRHAEDMRAETQVFAGSSTDSPLLPLATQARRDTFVESTETVDGPAPLSRETTVPSLMIAETFGPEEAIPMIQEAHMTRGLELEAMAQEARSEYESARAERAGQ